ncbi:MAG: hypothetical protein ACQEXQ_17310 [Bacillota bacterium]
MAADKDRAIVTLGVTSTRPETGYGYIRTVPSDDDGALVAENSSRSPRWTLPSSSSYLMCIGIAGSPNADGNIVINGYRKQHYYREPQDAGDRLQGPQRSTGCRFVAQEANSRIKQGLKFF